VRIVRSGFNIRNIAWNSMEPRAVRTERNLMLLRHSIVAGRGVMLLRLEESLNLRKPLS